LCALALWLLLGLLLGLSSACSPSPLNVYVSPGTLTAAPGQSVSFYAYARGPGQELMVWDVGTLTPALDRGPLPNGLLAAAVPTGEPGVARITLTPAPDFSIPELDVHVFACLRTPGSCFENHVHLTVVLSTLTGALPEPMHIAPGGEHIAAGGGFSLALLADGSVWAWGDNDDGQLGDNAKPNSSVPVPIAGLPGPVTAITVGGRHSLALLPDGSVWAWGDNGNGQLGDGTNSDSPIPVPVAGLPGPVTALAAGWSHSLARLADGSVWAWGYNTQGQLGDGTNSDSPIPVPVLDLPSPVAAIAAGSFHSLALLSDGSIWGWGINGDGELGDGTTTSSPLPVPGANLPGVVAAVAAGGRHSLALLPDGSVWAWGSNGQGQLGDGTVSDLPDSVPVGGLPGPVVAIAAGGSHSVALLADGSVWAWGFNEDGRLGDGTTSNTPIPVQVIDLPQGRVRSIAAGSYHTLFHVGCGQVWASGTNDSGQLGNGSHTTPARPVLVARIGEGGACTRVALRIWQTGPLRGIDTDHPAIGRCERRLCSALFDRGQTVSLSADPADFLGWDGDCQGTVPTLAVQLDRSTDCIANFGGSDLHVLLSMEQPGASGRVSSAPEGGLTFTIFRSGGTEDVILAGSLDCGEQCSAFYAPGTVVTLTATPNPGRRFNGWSGDCAGSDPQIQVTMDSDKHCRALFDTFQVSVAKVGQGRITSSPSGLDCGSTCDFAPGTATATLFATPDLGWGFDGWSGDCSGTDPQTTLTMDANKSCGASFSRDLSLPVLEVLKFSGAFGDVVSTPPGIDCGATCIAEFPPGTVVQLQATPAAGYQPRWGSECPAPPGSLTTEVTVTTTVVCQVVFETLPAFPVAQPFSVSAPTGQVAGQPITFDASSSYEQRFPGGPCFSCLNLYEWDFEDDGVFDASGDFNTGRVVSHVFQDPGNYVVRLRVTGGDPDPGGVLPTDEITQTVFIEPVGTPVWHITVHNPGPGFGSITSDPVGIDCGPNCFDQGPVPFVEGTFVTLTATPEAGWAFDSWIGCVFPADNLCLVSMVQDYDITGIFVRPTFDLTGDVLAGNGSVAFDPAGAPCGTDCQSYAIGTTVELTAVPDTDWAFDSWQRDCTGIDPTVQVLMDRAKHCSAVFFEITGYLNLTIQINGTGRVVEMNNRFGIDCAGTDTACTYQVPVNTAPFLQIPPANQAHFQEWSGCDDNPTPFVCESIMVSGDKTVTATFN
jgi:alpha-tubulin suppressor-like RCC1 family protein/PKD repeat protein